MRNREQISTAVLLRGIDMQLENAELWHAAESAARRLADHWSLRLVTVATNIRFLGYDAGLRWSRHYQGAGLAAVAHLVPHQRALIAASHHVAELGPNGSHPLTDPMWSAPWMEVVHEGAIERTRKLAALVRDPVALEVLRVCWHDAGFNCGKCEKCVRTRVALRLLGAPAPTFPGKLDLADLDALRVERGGRLDYLMELLTLEREHPDPAIRRRLEALIRSYHLRAAAKLLNTALGNPLGRR
jgi:hypothetical protein